MEQLTLEAKLNLFKWKQYESAIILLTVRWYLKYAAKCFFTKALSSPHTQIPRVITLDQNPAYPPAIQELINEKSFPKETLIRQTKYLNNIVEQDHRFIKKITKPMLGFKSFLTADQTLKGIEALHMIRKGQADDNSTVLTAVEWLNKIFGLVA